MSVWVWLLVLAVLIAGSLLGYVALFCRFVRGNPDEPHPDGQTYREAHGCDD